ncbi:hypothetical protein NA57DRAFT_78402 [Rhizodiscina lignyota]|uniref:N-acetylgalactosaminide beta-1,3-galactosyltransferase n=1 Tax=Rhizodiscina lignyota TaxID=1504668 RepID=A0A9P4ICM0_9PEZI|nr:hypothetical protein NA57DRAFT_78402 [Rhizodiscina lignyota]
MNWARRIPPSFRRPRALLILICSIASLLYLLNPLSGLGKRRYDIWREDPYIQLLDDSTRQSKDAVPSEARCKGFPPSVFDKIQVVVKIGAPEARTKLTRQLATNTACVKDLLIFSDFEEEVQGYHIYDALANLKESEWVDNPDYDVYKQNKAAKDNGESLSRSSEGWKLDKYKFLPMMDMTWEMRSQKDWFVFIEADSYVFWDNLFRWLGHLDPEKALYMGSPIWRVTPPEPTFAHGGSGIVVSRAGLKKLVRPRDYNCDVAGCTQYGFDFRDKCCGDAVLSDVFDARGISLKGYWPMINGEKPATVRYGKDEQWCEPIIIMHHVNETDQMELTDWEIRRPSSNPVMFEDLWNWLEHLIPPYRTDWSVLAEGDVLKAEDGQAAAASPQACELGCLEKKWCYQWQHMKGVCEHSPWIRVGREQLPDMDGNTCVSGTIMKRVANFKKRMGHCEDAHWVRANPG